MERLEERISEENHNIQIVLCVYIFFTNFLVQVIIGTKFFTSTIYLYSVCFVINLTTIFVPNTFPYRYLYILSILINLPILSSHLLITNDLEPCFIIHYMMSLFTMMLLLPRTFFMFFSIIGTCLGIAIAFIDIELSIQSSKNIIVLIYGYILMIIIWFVFLKYKYKEITKEEENFKDFIFSILHEVNTPISSIILNSQLTQKYLNSPDKVRELSKNIYYKVQEIIAIIQISSMNFNNAKINLNLKFVDIIPIIKEALENFNNYNLTELVVLESTDSFFVYTDQILLKYIALNLIRNALFFIESSGKGKLYIKFVSTNKSDIIIFRDTSIGISKYNVDKIFSRFFTTRKSGTGIGLYFCNKVMKLMNGKITCESKKNLFTQFNLILPRRGLQK